MRYYEETEFKEIKNCVKDHDNRIRTNAEDISYLKGWTKILTILISLLITVLTYLIYNVRR